MIILYVGDIMAEPGIRVVEKLLPDLRKQRQIDVVIAQGENISDGKGIRRTDFNQLKKAGVDFLTGGNHSLYRDEIYPQLSDPAQPIIRPANYPAGTPGLSYKYLSTAKGDVLIVSLLGKIVGKDAELPVDNPLQIIDRILQAEKTRHHVATVVNFHGDYSSEKLTIGHYLDGRASMVVGDHWHIATADAQVLPNGTAHISDVGMCGSLDSSLGVKFDSLILRWREGKPTQNIIETKGRMQLNALLVEVNEETGLALSAEHIRRIL
jgi:2',3'-cyclic-nucleotide 2'-phosphodiesterase